MTAHPSKVVPVEPSDEMLLAGLQEMPWGNASPAVVRDVYRACLAASPVQSAPQGGGEAYLSPGDLFWGVCRAGHIATNAASVLRSSPEKIDLVIGALYDLAKAMDEIINEPSKPRAALATPSGDVLGGEVVEAARRVRQDLDDVADVWRHCRIAMVDAADTDDVVGFPSFTKADLRAILAALPPLPNEGVTK